MPKKRVIISSVYAILNTETGETYIGSSSDTVNRINHHHSSIKRGDHPNPKIREASLKYSIESFAFVVIEECDKDILYEKETYWLDLLQPEYNTLLEASFRNKGLESYKLLISELKKGNQYGLGHKRTEEAKRIDAEAHMGNKYGVGNKSHTGLKESDETKAKKSEKMKIYWANRRNAT